MSLLALEKVSVARGEVRVLHDVSLNIAAGEVVAILGANGVGKSTLLRTVSGLHRPIAGKIFYDGHETTAVRTETLARRGLALVPEGRGLLAELTVDENLRLGATVPGVRKAAPALERALDFFPILRERRLQRAGMLSGGEQQMLALARAFVSMPKLLMVDELSLGLAPKVTRTLLGILVGMKAEGITTLLVEQNARQALEFADRVYVLANGRVALSGTSVDLRDRTELIEAYLGAA
jgi:branched-chain amino acid transport system ATP-binding protein